MKRFLSLLLVFFVLTVSIAGCTNAGGGDSGNTGDSSDSGNQDVYANIKQAIDGIVNPISIPSGAPDSVQAMYEITDKRDGTTKLGTVVALTVGGYAGDIHMIVGIATDQTIVKVIVDASSESHGKAGMASYPDKFAGIYAPDVDSVELFTGATTTSFAIKVGVIDAIIAVLAIPSDDDGGLGDNDENQGGNQPGGDDNQGGNQPGGDENQGGNQPGGDENQGGNQPGGDENQGGNQPGGDENQGGNQPGGDENQGGNQPGGDDNQGGNQPGGDENQGGNQPGGDDNQGGSQPGGDENQGSNQPGGDDNQGGNQPDDDENQGGNQPGGDDNQGGNQSGGDENQGGEEGEESHQHVFNQQICEEIYLVGEAPCESSMIYNYSCICGAKGEAVFTHGNIGAEHQWTSGECSRCNLICWHEGGLANCSTLAVCDCCGESYGELGDHEYYERNEIISEANCVLDGEIRYYCFCGDYMTEIVPAHGHKWKDWSEYTAVSCSSDGERIRGCHNCLEIDREVVDMVDHSYTKVKSETTAEGVSTITLVCCYCDAPAGESYEGFYLQSAGVMLLENCPNNYSFTVYCEGGEEYLRSTLRIGRLHHLTAAMDGDYENLEKYLIEDMGGGVYSISPTAEYLDGATYFVLADEGVSMIDKTAGAFYFRISGNTDPVIEYNSNTVFLKESYNNAGLPYVFSIDYNEQYELYVLCVPTALGYRSDIMGKLLVIGDCESFEEADKLPSDEVFIGKIEYVVDAQDGITLIALSFPDISDIYSELRVSGSGIPEQDDSIISDELKDATVAALCRSDAFASAIARANIAAKKYANSMGLLAEEDTKIDPAKIKINARVVNQGGCAVTVIMDIDYEHKIAIKEGDTVLGHVVIKLYFECSYGFDVNAYTNLEEYKNGDERALTFEVTLINTITDTLDVSITLDMEYHYTGEELFCVNTKSRTIHATSCRYCPPAPGGKYVFMNRSELRATYGDYSVLGCSVCQPFASEDTGFVVNLESGKLHINTCIYADMIDESHKGYYKTFPHHLSTEPCSICNPQNYTKSLEQYLSDSVKDENYGEMFEFMKSQLGDKFGGGGESPIDKDTKPRVTLRFYCFEMPIYIEPKVDFDLEANLSFHYQVTFKNTNFCALVYDDNGCRVLADSIGGVPDESVKLTVTGKFHTEIGVIFEARIGLRYMTKYVYLGFLGEAGAYITASGIFHADTEAMEKYHAARLEIGYYTRVAVTYRIIGIVPADSHDIHEKTYTPLFNSGDDRVFYRYADYDGEITIKNTYTCRPSNGLLAAYCFDLEANEIKLDELKWSEKTQYGFECIFTDVNGNPVDYISFSNGMIRVSEDAPVSFEVYMTVRVYDKVCPDGFAEYFGTNNKGGVAIFLAEKVIKINFSYEDTRSEMDEILGIYMGKYGVGYDMFGSPVYRGITLGIHKTEELLQNDSALELYASYASYVKLDENGNPEKIYTADDLRGYLIEMGAEYVTVIYNFPNNGIGDTLYVIGAYVAYYDDGYKIGASTDYSMESSASNYLVSTDYVFTDEGVSAKLYFDGEMTDYAGDLVAYKVTLGS